MAWQMPEYMQQSLAASTPKYSYFNQNPDLQQAYGQNNYGMDPYQFSQSHWNKWGAAEGRIAPYGTNNYFNQNPDVARAYTQNSYGMNPGDYAQRHWNQFGQNEQRAAPYADNPYFANNNDVAQAYQKNSYGMTPEQFAQTHYQKFGQTEQRPPPVFSGLLAPPAPTMPTQPVAQPMTQPTVQPTPQSPKNMMDATMTQDQALYASSGVTNGMNRPTGLLGGFQFKW